MKRLLFPLSILLAALAWMLFNGAALLSLHKRWWTLGDTYEIGYPLLGIAIYWVFTHRERLRTEAIAPDRLGAILFLLALLCSAAARVMQLQVLQQLMVPVSLWCGLFALLGWRLAVQLILPSSLLVAGVPVWDFLVEPLRIMTVAAVQGLLIRVDIPALVQGYRVILPGGVMLIEDACSGLNLLLAALVISTLHAELNLHSARRKLLVIGIGIAIGIIDNWLRVFILVAIAYSSDMKSSLVHDHVVFGWWLFIASLVPFFFIARLVERGDVRSTVQAGAADSLERSARPVASMSGATMASILAVLSTGLYASIVYWESHSYSSVKGFAAPATAELAGAGWLPQYSGYDAARTWRLAENGVSYDVAALTYTRQTPDKKLIFYTNRIAAEKDTRYTAKLAVAGGVAVNETVIRDRNGGERIVWWFYWIDNALASDAVTAKFLQFKAGLAGDRSATLVAVSRVCRETNCSAERQNSAVALKPLVQHLLAAQKSTLDRVSNPAR
ncbi:MAG TPA: exosortase [Spongiibacteraceae bacterium]|nr:exosortase [Spongiibacteraceae bacterium]